MNLKELVFLKLKVVESDSKIVELRRFRNSKDKTEQLKVVFDGCLTRKVGFDNLTLSFIQKGVLDAQCMNTLMILATEKLHVYSISRIIFVWVF